MTNFGTELLTSSKARTIDNLGQALALLPIDWAEPFGLVMIEAMACGTPVIARPCGSVPEVLKDGVTGFTASDVDELVAAVRKVGDLPRDAVREEFERCFTAETMTARYEQLYFDLIEGVDQSAALQSPLPINMNNLAEKKPALEIVDRENVPGNIPGVNGNRSSNGSSRRS